MLIIAITTLLIIIGVVIYSFNEEETIGGLIITIFTLLLIIMSVKIYFVNATANQQIEKFDIKYENLMSQIEIVNSDNVDAASKITVNQNIADWNTEVSKYKHFSESPWTNLFISKKFVDSLKCIDQNSCKSK